MSGYDNTNTGALFAKDPATERHPTWGGEVNIEGKEYWVSGWNKTSKSGMEFVSLAVKPKEAAPADEVPF